MKEPSVKRLVDRPTLTQAEEGLVIQALNFIKELAPLLSARTYDAKSVSAALQAMLFDSIHLLYSGPGSKAQKDLVDDEIDRVAAEVYHRLQDLRDKSRH